MFDTAPATSKMMLAKKVVKVDFKIIISLPQSKLVKQTVMMFKIYQCCNEPLKIIEVTYFEMFHL
jgi:hypothetical protein